jgi:hypothetical protein
VNLAFIETFPALGIDPQPKVMQKQQAELNHETGD